jgi:valyl-tRNA synthetase
MPFITEEIWQRAAPLAGRKGETVMLQPYPTVEEFALDSEAEREVEWLQKVIQAVRQIRGEMSISPSRQIPLLMQGASATDLANTERHRAYLEKLAGLESITVIAKDATAPQSATALVGELVLLVPMAGLIDAAAEADRLAKRIVKAQEDLGKTNAKLTNDNFVRNAPEAVVALERERAADLERTIGGLQEQLTKVRRLIQP